jgi:hypothetical protein
MARVIPLAALAGWIALLGGCRAVNPFQSAPPSAPVVFQAAPGQRQLIEAINANSAEVRQLSCDVQIRMEGVPPLSGTLIVEKPKKLRLKAGLIGMTEMGVDMGSNDEAFWIWTKSSAGGQAPTFYYASHREFAQSPMRQSLPFEPQWIIDALGFLTLPEDGSVKGPFQRGDGRYELRIESLDSSPLSTRILVVDSKTGLVQQQAFYNAQHQLVAYANAIQHQYFEAFHASLPRRIEVVALGPDQRPTSLTVDLAGHEINQLYGDPERQWTMPQPADAQWVHLAQAVGGTQAP